jgi:lipoprotein-anchoring transpeptidase ErfK/SrfK
VKINVDEQKARLYNGDEEIGWTYVASGITSFPTPTGEFKVLEKIADKVSNLYGKGFDAAGKLVNSDFKQGRDLLPPGGSFEPAKMTYFMRLTGDGVGMHIGAIPRPGRRASHGCIRLPSKFAGTSSRTFPSAPQ